LEFDAAWRELESSFDRPRSRAEGFVSLSRFLAKIQCGHTYPNFFNQPKEVQSELFEGRNRLPFTFRWLGERMVVRTSLAPEADLPRGTEIVAVDGRPAGQILRSLMEVARADGGNDNKRRDYLAVTGGDRFEAFDIYYPLLFPVRESGFELKVRAPGARTTRLVRVQPIDLARRRAAQTGLVPPKADAPMWTDREIAPDVTLLSMPSWSLYNSKWNWRGYLDSVFDRLAENPRATLVLDLRGNEGGNSVGRHILARLTTGPLPGSSFDQVVRYRTAPADLRPYLSTWDRSFYDWGTAAKDDRPGRFRLRRGFDEDAAPINPQGPRFTGRVFALMGATNSSATFAFLDAAKSMRLATLVGQTSGGNRRGINGGAFFFMTLPNSKIEVDIPLIGYFAPGSQPDAGVEPDIAIKPTIEAIARGEDQELEAVLQRLGKRPILAR